MHLAHLDIEVVLLVIFEDVFYVVHFDGLLIAGIVESCAEGVLYGFHHLLHILIREVLRVGIDRIADRHIL